MGKESSLNMAEFWWSVAAWRRRLVGGQEVRVETCVGLDCREVPPSSGGGQGRGELDSLRPFSFIQVASLEAGDSRSRG